MDNYCRAQGQAAVALYVLALVAIVVSVDVLETGCPSLRRDVPRPARGLLGAAQGSGAGE